MNTKELHTADKDKVVKACLALDNDNKKALCEFLKKSVELWEAEVAEEGSADWGSLEYLKESSAKNALEQLVDFVQAWRYDEDEIAELDKEIVALLEQSPLDTLVEKLSNEYSDMEIYITKDQENVVRVEMWVDNDSDMLTVLVKTSDIETKGFAKALIDQAKSYGNISTEIINEIEQKFNEKAK